MTLGMTFNMPQLFILHYQHYNTFDISKLFYDVTSLDENIIVKFFGDTNYDIKLEANLENDTFGIKVKSTKTNQPIDSICISISFYYYISNTIHQNNVKKMFDNWSEEIFYAYKSLIKQHSLECNNKCLNV